MALQLGALRDALEDAGATADKAARAAEEVATYERDVAGLRADMTAMRGELRLLRWMMGTNILITLGVLWRLLAH